MKSILLIFSAVLLFGCSPKIVTVNTETVRTEIQTVVDTLVVFKLAPSSDFIQTNDTLSTIKRKTAVTTAKISRGTLTHTLDILDVPIPVQFKYIKTVIRDTTTKTIVQPISKADQKKIDGFDKLKESNKTKDKTILSLIASLVICGLWIFRKPILKLIKPI